MARKIIAHLAYSMAHLRCTQGRYTGPGWIYQGLFTVTGEGAQWHVDGIRPMLSGVCAVCSQPVTQAELNQAVRLSRRVEGPPA
jgi:hypothetical protein